ncbi:MAG: hypothetical protein AB7O80_15670 [Acetobacteraceae bacterium]
MSITPLLRAGLLAAAVAAPTLATPTTALAQNVILDAPALQKKQVTRMPDVKPAPLAWPRLDPGAVFCRSEDDLERLALRRQGQDPGGLTDCRLVSVPTAVTIVQRRGPGRTEVRLSDAASVTGWTDVWLPDKAPVSAGRTVR